MADTLDSHEWQTHSRRHQMTRDNGETTVSNTSMPSASSHSRAVSQVALDNIDERQCQAWLMREWSCSLPGHGVCISTADQEHYQLSDKAIQVWVKALVCAACFLIIIQ